MAADRLLRILSRFSSFTDVETGTPRLCDLCADVTVMSGAGIMLMSGDVPRGSVCTSNDGERADRGAAIRAR